MDKEPPSSRHGLATSSLSENVESSFANSRFVPEVWVRVGGFDSRQRATAFPDSRLSTEAARPDAILTRRPKSPSYSSRREKP